MGLGLSPQGPGTPSSLNQNRWRLFLHNLGRVRPPDLPQCRFMPVDVVRCS